MAKISSDQLLRVQQLVQAVDSSAAGLPSLGDRVIFAATPDNPLSIVITSSDFSQRKWITEMPMVGFSKPYPSEGTPEQDLLNYLNGIPIVSGEVLYL